MSERSDTIFARASGAGKAGVAVFRLSGPDAFGIFNQLVGKRIDNRAAHMVSVCDPESRAVIDRGLAILFEGPASFTGEDVAELHLHGSRAVETALYEALARLGARPAEAGEFTLRALRNGKLDLAQVEALADLIDSETTLQRMQALGQLDGRLSEAAEGWRQQVLDVLAPLEADIDFPDEGDVPAAVATRAGPAIKNLKSSLTAFLNQSVRARKIREGVSIAIIGPPNAGKSSLMNALAGSEVAIVSDIAGTTRDVVETRLDLAGMAASVADTAGLRGMAGDVIEAEGIKRARQKAAAADIRVLVLDASEDVPRETILEGETMSVSRETLALLKPGDIIAWNKADIAKGAETRPEREQSPFTELAVSAKTGEGMAALLHALTQKAAEGASDGPALTRARHAAAVEEALGALSRAEANIETAPELAAEDARLAARALGKITGAVGVEDVLGEIFSSFCIGK
ncbi:tRNA uridine-5-carboxymethylaminomethyl(34) synthesis GTPase MnmE [Hyphococcus luteus]|uniref:tRNA modification GTPase MnmE n=1 Tax=Hyphococcus luteus TaxID=2058213 RepID=A0A2S7K6Q8_9PROT|nr:tRNA uridine-5-carboxymethylaminomethyl(34) synthesis GTPase MnmE [Marinicaulis flavus]PQA88187.1 tRNA uridine-5-carboxymethylaminomethyl(34) synthesis GTPase MnmE [Marinicaulis flavus]